VTPGRLPDRGLGEGQSTPVAGHRQVDGGHHEQGEDGPDLTPRNEKRRAPGSASGLGVQLVAVEDHLRLGWSNFRSASAKRKSPLAKAFPTNVFDVSSRSTHRPVRRFARDRHAGTPRAT
jgi:hypothetical protein